MDWFVYVIVNAARIAHTGIATEVGVSRCARHSSGIFPAMSAF